MILRAIILTLFACVQAQASQAGTSAGGTAGADREYDGKSATLLRRELSARYPGTQIDLLGTIRWENGGIADDPATVTVSSEGPLGTAQFVARDAEGAMRGSGSVDFAAWIPAKIALKRVRPGERLTGDMFVVQKVNVATGEAHEFRGVIADAGIDVATLESRQSILEGQLLLTSAVQRLPDIRRGDNVRIQIVTDGLVLSTQGIAQEPGYTDSQIHVLTTKSKRDLVGRLDKNGVVEVKL